MKKMTTSRKGLQLIKDFEGLRLGSYKCPAGVWTIGYGHTKGVRQGQVIDQMRADDMLIEDIAPIERLLNSIGINFRQEQFDALVSWIFNLGQGSFKNSTILKRIMDNADDTEIADQIIRWVYASGKILTGLKKRRIAEANMFLGYERYYLDDKNNIQKK
jgi:lysozyme